MKTRHPSSRFFSPESSGTWSKQNSRLRGLFPHERTNSTVSKRGGGLRRGDMSVYSEDENSPYAERMIARFKAWYPGKDEKVKSGG